MKPSLRVSQYYPLVIPRASKCLSTHTCRMKRFETHTSCLQSSSFSWQANHHILFCPSPLILFYSNFRFPLHCARKTKLQILLYLLYQHISLCTTEFIITLKCLCMWIAAALPQHVRRVINSVCHSVATHSSKPPFIWSRIYLSTSCVTLILNYNLADGFFLYLYANATIMEIIWKCLCT